MKSRVLLNKSCCSLKQEKLLTFETGYNDHLQQWRIKSYVSWNQLDGLFSPRWRVLVLLTTSGDTVLTYAMRFYASVNVCQERPINAHLH